MPDSSLPYPATPEQMNQQCTRHLGVVKDLQDPEGRGRVRIEVPGLLGTGKMNWTPWAECFSTPIGSANSGNGDEGFWWCVQHMQVVAVEFISGDPFAYAYSPGPPCQEEPGENKQLVPLEVKAVHKKYGPRAGTRVRVLKSEAGHTPFLIDDNGGHEFFAVRDWTGAGDVYYSPGKIEDEEEKECEESKPRKGKRRGVKTALTGAGKPSELLKDGIQIIARTDMLGQGMYTVATDGAGTLIIVAGKDAASVDNYYVLDTKSKLTLMGAGETQIWCDGEKGHVYSTSMIIQNQPPIDVEPMMRDIREKLAEREREYQNE